MMLAPIFLVFIVAHALLLGYGVFAHSPQIGVVAEGFRSGLSNDLATVGMIGVLAIFFRAYSLGGGTYTGIEAVANGMQIMREPKVKTGKRTMGYMAISLAILSGGLFLCYLLWNIPSGSGTDPECRTGDKCLWELAFGRSPRAGHHPF
jgi:hypothetical protein